MDGDAVKMVAVLLRDETVRPFFDTRVYRKHDLIRPFLHWTH